MLHGQLVSWFSNGRAPVGPRARSACILGRPACCSGCHVVRLAYLRAQSFPYAAPRHGRVRSLWLAASGCRLESLLDEKLALVERLGSGSKGFAAAQLRTDAYRQVRENTQQHGATRLQPSGFMMHDNLRQTGRPRGQPFYAYCAPYEFIRCTVLATGDLQPSSTFNAVGTRPCFCNLIPQLHGMPPAGV